MMDAAELHFRFAYFCLDAKCHVDPGNEPKFRKLQRDYLDNGTYPTAQEQDEIFKDSAKRRKAYASRINLDPWSPKLIALYWLVEHTRVIEQGEGDYALLSPEKRENCKVHIAQVIKRNQTTYLVKYDKTQIEVDSSILPDANQGDFIAIHRKGAVVNEKTLLSFLIS